MQALLRVQTRVLGKWYMHMYMFSIWSLFIHKALLAVLPNTAVGGYWFGTPTPLFLNWFVVNNWLTIWNTRFINNCKTQTCNFWPHSTGKMYGFLWLQVTFCPDSARHRKSDLPLISGIWGYNQDINCKSEDAGCLILYQPAPVNCILPITSVLP